ncbi:hypothetical protein, partial [Escherichia coli]|uniref:hypothetical protein n=1 Tax=Escherichia coli TaxID=562 RepID=UPI001BB04C64
KKKKNKNKCARASSRTWETEDEDCAHFTVCRLIGKYGAVSAGTIPSAEGAEKWSKYPGSY